MKLNLSVIVFVMSMFLLNLASPNLVKAQSSYIPPALPSIPQKVFNVKDYGGVGDDKTDNTKAIQSAIDAAVTAGGGQVVIPIGVYLCGPIHFGNNLNLHFDSGSILKMLPIDKYPGGITEGTSFISGAGLHDLAITGKGTIDGQGSPWWKYAKNKDAKRPRMIAFKNCDKILIDQVKLMNSPMFHIAIGGKTRNVTVQNVTVRAPSSIDSVNPSHNTDACDVTGHKILIKNCDISVGDDNYTCSGGTSDVLITNCRYGDGHGVSIGSYTRGGVSNITVENCTFTNTGTGVRIKTNRERGGIVENITYRNLKMTNVGIPILIYESYSLKDKVFKNLQKISPDVAATFPSAAINPKTPFYRNISLQNITATVEKGRRAGLIWGLPEANIENITLQNVNITADEPFGIFFCKNVQVKNCEIITSDGKNKLAMTNSSVTLDGAVIK